MTFVRDALLKPYFIIWNAVASLIGVASFFGIDSQVAITTRLLVSIVLFLLIALISMMFVAHDYYIQAKTPVAIRSVIEGTHFFQGHLILILDRSNWIQQGQLLVLVSSLDGVQIPLALLSVETTTTEGYPQCVVYNSLTKERLSKYLEDRSRWRSLSALPEIKSRYFEVLTNG